MESSADIVNVIGNLNDRGSEIFMDYSLLESLDERDYVDQDLLCDEGLNSLERFLRGNTRDVRMDEWQEFYGEPVSDELYRKVAWALDAVIMSYDGDYTGDRIVRLNQDRNDPLAVTPGIVL